MALRHAAIGGVEQLEPALDLVGNLSGRQRIDPGRANLDCQRQALNQPTDANHVGQVLVEIEVWQNARGALLEQTQRGAVRRTVRVAGDRQAGDVVGPFLAQLQGTL